MPPDPLTRLHETLRSAMVDGFAHVLDPGLGQRLRDDVDRLLRAEPDDASAWQVFRRALEGFDRLGRQDRSVLVARGMRLCATAKSTEPAPRRRRNDAATPIHGTQRTKASNPSVRAPPVDAAPPPPVTTLKGIGPSTAKKLADRGIETVEDLLYLLPTGYEDRRHPTPIDGLSDGDLAVLEATVRGLRQGFWRGRFMATMQLGCVDAAGKEHRVQARWFHRVGGLEKWARDGRVVAVGRIKEFRGELTLAHPELHAVDAELPAIAVRYPQVPGVAPRTLARAMAAALDAARRGDVTVRDALTPEIASAHGLVTQLQALEALHDPDPDASEEALQALRDGCSSAHRRLAFDELFLLQLWLLRQREAVRARPCPIDVPPTAFDRERLRACLPFEPTAAQWRVLDEIEADVTASRPMLRLLQGDVGSGKTAVGFGAALAVASGGGQVAMMAPTEILAEQHYRTLAPWCEKAGLRVALLTGATPRAERASLLALLQAGQIDLLVGTHALIVGDVSFAALGLVIVDEQHRFGVEQRALLRGKGQMPHLLVMTATPIPRTMALTAYGELEVSVIDEMPPGRTPPRTFLFTGAKGLARARAGVAKRVAAGDRCFVVCPLVEASDALDVTDVEATADALRSAMPGRAIGVVHGRLSTKDKDAIMRGFRSGELDVLVATTVIEVGVDVPDARLILVEHAERFGLAQLHQLRGRVGRGGGESFCLLHTAHGPRSEVAQRLAVLTQTTDGFVVAERDLALRGPGEVFGTRQAGAPRLRFWGFAGEGAKLLVQAREAAANLLERDPQLRGAPQLVAEIARRHAAREFFAPESG